MDDFALRPDLQRAVVNGFALPLGIVPEAWTRPSSGYMIAYVVGEDDQPDIYTFHAVVSHEHVRRLVRRAFEWLPDEVWPILEVSSCDAYRTVDVFLGTEPISLAAFMDVWNEFEEMFLEECSLAFGANADDPYIEVFVDSMKGVVIHAPLDMRDEVEALLQSFGLEEVPEVWAAHEDDDGGPPGFRNVMVSAAEDGSAPELDELVYALRQECGMELNVDPEDNVDESGRSLGFTLWWTNLLVERDDDPQTENVLTVWATAGSLAELTDLAESALAPWPGWRLRDIYTVERVPFDERPDELGDLPPRRTHPELHLVQFDPDGAASGKPSPDHDDA